LSDFTGLLPTPRYSAAAFSTSSLISREAVSKLEQIFLILSLVLQKTSRPLTDGHQR
jgi:hypothetical protein